MSETCKSNFFAYAISMRSARLTLNWERDRLRALEEGAPLPSPQSWNGTYVRIGSTSDRTQAEALHRIAMMNRTRESIAENVAKLKEFKSFITSAGLNDEATALVWADQCRRLDEVARSKHVSDEQLASIRACWEALSNIHSSEATITSRVRAALEVTEGNYPARTELAEAMINCHVQGTVARVKCEIANFSAGNAANQIEQIVQGESTNRRNGFCISPDPARIAAIVDEVARWA